MPVCKYAGKLFHVHWLSCLVRGYIVAKYENRTLIYSLSDLVYVSLYACLGWSSKLGFVESLQKVINCLDLNKLSLFFGRSSKLCHCHHFYQSTQNVNCLRELDSFDVVRVSVLQD